MVIWIFLFKFSCLDLYLRVWCSCKTSLLCLLPLLFLQKEISFFVTQSRWKNKFSCFDHQFYIYSSSARYQTHHFFFNSNFRFIFLRKKSCVLLVSVPVAQCAFKPGAANVKTKYLHPLIPSLFLQEGFVQQSRKENGSGWKKDKLWSLINPNLRPKPNPSDIFRCDQITTRLWNHLCHPHLEEQRPCRDNREWGVLGFPGDSLKGHQITPCVHMCSSIFAIPSLHSS